MSGRIRETLSVAFSQAVSALVQRIEVVVWPGLGLLVGMLSLTAMLFLVDVLEVEYDKAMTTMGADLLFVQRRPQVVLPSQAMDFGGRPRISAALAPALAQNSSHSIVVAPTVSARSDVSYRDLTRRRTRLLGTTPEWPELFEVDVVAGRLFLQREELASRRVCILGSDVATDLFGEGEAVGRQVKVRGVGLTVVGVIDRQRSVFDVARPSEVVLLPLSTFQQVVNHGSDATIVVRTLPGRLEDVRFELEGEMRRLRGLDAFEPNNFSIDSKEDVLSLVKSTKSLVARVGSFLTILTLFVGGLGVATTAFLSVYARTREIGIRRAAGARVVDIVTQLVFESIMISTFASAFALAIVVLALRGASWFYPMQLSGLVTLLVIAAGAGVGLLASLAPAYRASTIQPIDAIERE